MASHRTRSCRNDYLIDREKQKSGEVFSGLDWSFPTQDGCVVESMGPITDRENEHLGQGDRQIGAVRRFLMDAIREVQDGGDAPGVAFDVEENDFSELIMVSADVPTGVDWKAYAPRVTTHVLAGVR